METNREGLEHLFDEDNATTVEEQQQDLAIPIGEHAPIIPNASGGGPRSIVWHEYLVIPSGLNYDHDDDETRVGPSPSKTDDNHRTADKDAEDVTGADLKSSLAKKACRKERSDAPTSKSLNKLANQGDSNEPDSVGIPRGRKDKPRNAHKKRKDQRVPNDKSKSSQEVEEATMEDIYQISSGEEDCSQGMKKWIKEYHDRRPGLKVLQQRIDDFIASHEEQEEQAKKEREAKMTEEGWTVVVHHKGGKKTTDRESGVAVGSVAEAAVRDKLAKKKSKDVGLDFYRFQKKEAQRSEIMKLQSKFEEDKKRIQQLRAARKFRPY